ncbi:MAG TPA: thioesterase domain-containing protein, partial [Blastocatellia bacterium]|nr:thioesterase domain-containing protein [Blastocatellia bacterium]
EGLKAKQAAELVRWGQGRGAEVVNHYGPTECTVGVVTHRVGVEEVEASSQDGGQGGGQGGSQGGGQATVAIGRLLGNVRGYVVSGGEQAAGPGMVGELYIGGAAVGRGYVNEAAETASRFVPDAYSGEAGARLYRTGDVVKYSAAGELEYLGRSDQQVKVRGYRVELGEIEAAVNEEAGVRASAVVVREEEGRGPQVVCYVVGEDGAEVSGKRLREGLSRRLPEYMVPAAFVMLGELPLTANGKLDRKALPAPVHRASEEILLPRDSTELQLFEIWSAVLGIDNFGIQETFFDLGGHSLSAVSLAVKVSDVYGKNIPVRAVFDHQTIEQMACYLREEVAIVPPSTVIPIQPRGSRLPFFCVHAASGLAQIYIPVSRRLGKSQPFYGLQACGLEVGQAPLSDIREMAAKYLADIRTIQPAGPYQIGGYSFGAIVAYEIAQQLKAAQEEVALLAIFDATPRSGSANGPLTEAELQAHEHQYLINRLENVGLAVDDIKSKSLSELLQLNLAYEIEENHMVMELTEAQYLRLLRVRVLNPHAARQYTPRPYPGRITLFRRHDAPGQQHDYGWEKLALGGVDVYCFDSDHDHFMSDPNAVAVAAQLAGCLGNAGLPPRRCAAPSFPTPEDANAFTGTY